MISPSSLVSWVWKKKSLAKGWSHTFSSYFQICFQVWLRTGQGDVSAFSFWPFFFFWHGIELQPPLRSILTRRLCFVSWKFLILLMQTENAVLCSPPCSWKESTAADYFFFCTSPRSWMKKKIKKGQKNPLNPWMDSHQSHMHLRERQSGTQWDGWRGAGGGGVVECFGWRQSKAVGMK